jgi:hypothetical protein
MKGPRKKPVVVHAELDATRYHHRAIAAWAEPVIGSRRAPVGGQRLFRRNGERNGRVNGAARCAQPLGAEISFEVKPKT